MRTAWLLPLEKVKGRYTEQWYNNFPKAFVDAAFDVKVIDGEMLTDFVDTGSWLPMNSTVVFKNSQVTQIAKAFQNKEVKDGDIVFLYDIEFWGFEAIKMMAQINNIDLKIYGFLHAASYTREDLMEQLTPWQKYTEMGWIAACDKVFVGSNYHKDAVIQRRVELLSENEEDVKRLRNKIVVTGNPVFQDEYEGMLGIMPNLKKKQIILPNRFDFEKRPNISLDIAYNLKKKHPDWNFVITTSHPKLHSNRQWLLDKARNMAKDGIIEIREGLTKAQYHTVLAESRVMLTNSIEENFGYCIIEAMIYGTYPLAPRGLSHSELLQDNKFFLYDDLDEVESKIDILIDLCYNMSEMVEPHYHALNRIVLNCI